jgi:hypothetical protein
MNLFILHNCVRDKMYAEIDAQIALLPEDKRELAKLDREIFYQTLLNHYGETGEIPEFSLVKREQLS